MRVAALGRTDRLYDSILEVARRGHEIVLVGTCPAAPDYTRTEEDFARLAADLGCPFFCNPRLARPGRVAEIERSGAEIAISVNWPTLIPPSVLTLFEHGIINAHLGDLPRYRGNAAPNWAILAGEPRVVLTLHEMSEALDAGPIVRQRAFALTPETYIGDVDRFATETVPILFGDVVDAAARGTLERRPQPADPGVSLRGLSPHAGGRSAGLEPSCGGAGASGPGLRRALRRGVHVPGWWGARRLARARLAAAVSRPRRSRPGRRSDP